MFDNGSSVRRILTFLTDNPGASGTTVICVAVMLDIHDTFDVLFEINRDVSDTNAGTTGHLH